MKEVITPEPTEIITFKAYSCPVCTFNNFDNPIKLCSVCGAEAPESAKVITKVVKAVDPALEAKQAQEKTAKEEEEKKAKDREEK